jgi:hypothetical protein
LECFDADQFTADDLLGRLYIDLGSVLKGTLSPERCTPKMLKNSKWPKIDLFKTRQIRGWWPFMPVEFFNNKEAFNTAELAVSINFYLSY